MKFQSSITVNVPLKRLVDLLDNPENMKYWQQGLQSFEMLDGEPGAVGSTMRMNYLHGNREVSMIESITKNDLPNAFSATYECKGVWNLIENYFSENPDGSTVWTSDCEFKFSGMMRVMSWFMPKSMFQKQNHQFLEDFKAFAER